MYKLICPKRNTEEEIVCSSIGIGFYCPFCKTTQRWGDWEFKADNTELKSDFPTGNITFTIEERLQRLIEGIDVSIKETYEMSNSNLEMIEIEYFNNRTLRSALKIFKKSIENILSGKEYNEME